MDKKLFYSGLSIRLVLIFICIPIVQQTWFIPFYQGALSEPTLDPWRTFLSHGGNALSFPYGVVMYLAYLPGQVIAHLLLGISLYMPFILFGLTTLALDILMLLTLKRLTGNHDRSCLIYYWLSPIVLFICYWHGQLDLLPIFLLVFSLCLLNERHERLAALVFACSISAKLSMIIVLPILLIYLWRNRTRRPQLLGFSVITVLAYIIIQGPWLLSSAYQTMLFGNPELTKATDVYLPVAKGLYLYLLPLVYFIFLRVQWHIKRTNCKLLLTIIGISFVLILILTPASIGWYLWIVPFFVVYQASSQSSLLDKVAISAFSLLFVLYGFSYESGSTLWLWPDLLNNAPILTQILSLSFSSFQSGALTLLSSMLIVIAISMFSKGIRNNDYYRLSRNMIAVGIAGDSGTGKDTLSQAIANMFHDESVTSLFGDDYHKWDRYSPMWKKLTHLNPQANNLSKLTHDVICLLSGEKIAARHYDHDTGRFTPCIAKGESDILLINGLHTLYSERLRASCDLKIYLQPSEDLRRYFKLRRDVAHRGKSYDAVVTSMLARMPDFQRYIEPQAQYADIVFALHPVRPSDLSDIHVDKEIPLMLEITMIPVLSLDKLHSMLLGLCGLDVRITHAPDGARIGVKLWGNVSASDISVLAEQLVPQLYELLAYKPVWSDGVIGLMQLFVLLILAEKLHERLY